MRVSVEARGCGVVEALFSPVFIDSELTHGCRARGEHYECLIAGWGLGDWGGGGRGGLAAIGARHFLGAINRGNVTSNILGIKSFERYLQIPRDM